MAIPVQSYRKWARVFERGGARFDGKDGKNHLVWSFVPKGDSERQSFALVAHHEGADIKPIYIRKVRRLWKLLPEDGVSDHDFMEGNWPK